MNSDLNLEKYEASRKGKMHETHLNIQIKF